MSTDFEKGLRKTIDLSVRSREFTVDTLKSAMQDFLSGKSQKKGRVSMKKLSEHSGKLENVEIKGIEDFLSVAKKYDIDMPIIEQVNSVLFEDQPAKDAVMELMLRDKKAEHEDIQW